MKSIEKMFESAIELRDKGQLRDAVVILSKIVDNYSNDKRIAGFHGVLGGVYIDLEEHEKALDNFKKATILSPKSELASIGLYVSYVNVDKDEEAIRELIRYLKNYPADMYKITLEELLEGLEDGYMTDYEKEIRDLAKVNGVELS
jgi:tetratricopeptide (TPR) repeat protein